MADRAVWCGRQGYHAVWCGRQGYHAVWCGREGTVRCGVVWCVREGRWTFGFEVLFGWKWHILCPLFQFEWTCHVCHWWRVSVNGTLCSRGIAAVSCV